MFAFPFSDLFCDTHTRVCFCQQIARALQSLMEWDPEAQDEDMESHFMLTFQVSTDMFGSVHTHNLKENGDTIPVTKENRKVCCA